MSDVSSGSAVQQEIKKIENLRQSHTKGLTENEGAFLYLVLKLQMGNGWQGVTQDDIYASGFDPEELKENRLKRQEIGRLGSGLQKLKWDDEQTAYLCGGVRSPGGKEGYALPTEVFATIPRTIKVALEAQRWKKFRPGFEGQIRRDDFVKDFSTSFRIEISAVERAIDFLLEHRYFYRFPNLEPVHFRPDHRLALEMEYLRRAEKLFQPGIALPESELTTAETAVLVELWKAKHLEQARGLTADDLKRRIGAQVPDIESLLRQLGDNGRNMLEWNLANPLIYRVYYWVLQWPPDAQFICDVIDHEAIPLPRTAVIKEMSQKFKQSAHRIKKDLLIFAETAGYIVEAPGNPGKIVATRRAKEHRPFLEAIGNLFEEWKEDNREGQTWQPTRALKRTPRAKKKLQSSSKRR
ncbi:MAG TPA: hypothetical protein VKZ53_28480 [Candidatus Angelobacter sp.]|nr:hypothetical protein [Candidatus Angelobacter sp.]